MMKNVIFGLVCYMMGVILAYYEYFGSPMAFGIVAGVIIGATAGLLELAE